MLRTDTIFEYRYVSQLYCRLTKGVLPDAYTNLFIYICDLHLHCVTFHRIRTEPSNISMLTKQSVLKHVKNQHRSTSDQQVQAGCTFRGVETMQSCTNVLSLFE